MKTIRWGILGTGSIADEFLAGLRLASGSEVVAVASRQLSNAQSFAARNGIPHADGLEAMLGRPDVDVIYVATPVPLHAQHARACLLAGKGVLMEKPFASTAAEARDTVALARERRLFCMEAMWMRFQPAIQELVRQVKSARHGRVLSVEAELGFANATVRPEGALLDLGVYPVSLVHALLGRPQRVQAMGGPAEVSLLLSFEGGVQAVVRASHRSPLRNDALITTEGANLHLEAPVYRSESFSIRPFSASAAGARPGAPHPLKRLAQRPELRRWVQRARALASQRVTVPALGNGYAHEAIEVNECLRQGALESGVLPLDETVAVMETLDAAQRALQ